MRSFGHIGLFGCLMSQTVSMGLVMLLWGPRGQPRTRWERYKPESAMQILTVRPVAVAVGRHGAVGIEPSEGDGGPVVWS